MKASKFNRVFHRWASVIIAFPALKFSAGSLQASPVSITEVLVAAVNEGAEGATIEIAVIGIALSSLTWWDALPPGEGDRSQSAFLQTADSGAPRRTDSQGAADNSRAFAP